jgi:sulfatase maturation enzyme AslB (radical SAM superfamily)
MSKKRIMMIAAIVVGLATARSLAPTAVAAPRADAGIKQTMQLLVLMETDTGGKVSKAEFMKFMEAEFDKLDKNKDGELDVKELTQSQYSVHVGTHR